MLSKFINVKLTFYLFFYLSILTSLSKTYMSNKCKNEKNVMSFVHYSSANTIQTHALLSLTKILTCSLPIEFHFNGLPYARKNVWPMLQNVNTFDYQLSFYKTNLC